jgi:oligopeptide transport system substrate-binding protein
MMKRILHILLLVTLVCSLLVLYLPSGCQSEQEAEVTPTEENTLNLYGIDPWTLDPAVSGEMTSHEYIMQLFSGLVCLDDNLEPAPDIAQRWQVSDDGRTYTFYLQHDVKFHNGREVKAEDFEYSWERACNPDTRSLTADTYLGDIVGVREVLAGKTKEISGVRVIGDYTLEVTIDAPKSYFLSKLTYPTAFVVDRANVESGGEWWRQPNGTGPFKLRQWDEESLLVLEKNDLYYGNLAKANFVAFHLWGGVPMNMYETGEIDVTGIYIDYIDKVTDKAVSLVFRGMVQPADGILPPGMPGFNEDLSGLGYDVTEARELIQASRYGDVSNLPPITLTTMGWGGLISQGLEAIISEWRNNLGVEVRVRQLEPERFLYYLRQEKDEMFYMGWVADYPHPQNFLDILFHSGAENNYGEYSHPEIDALLEMAGVKPDYDSSLALYQQAEQKLVEDAACLPLWFGKNHILVKPYIKGYNLSPQGLVLLNNVSIERD